MRRVPIALSLLVALVLAPAAFAGGWATVGLDSTPEGTPPGQAWNVNITVLQHGRTPLADVQPTVTIRNGDATKTFVAKPTKEVGVYRASVTFPSAGKWVYAVNDGFVMNHAHTFPPVRIGAGAGAAPTPAMATDGGGRSLTWLAIPGLALIAAAIALVLVRDRRRPDQPQAA